MNLFRIPALLLLFAAPVVRAQTTADPAPITATWETQKQARTFMLGIPAPRGQITDRNGAPLAQSRMAHNLAMVFPTPPTLSDVQVLAHARKEIAAAERLLSRRIPVEDDAILKHYHNRPLLPMELVQDLLPPEIAVLKNPPAGLMVRPVYQRFYPNGRLAGHLLGYCGRRSGLPDRPLQNNDLLWPDSEGREGIEQTFDKQLQGKVGQMNVTFDEAGNKSSESVAIPPEPGQNVVTTLDEALQRKCEELLEKNTERGAIVVMDPNNGDILAMASWPVFNPNDFIPFISADKFKRLQEDPDVPLLPRAYRSAYPPGSVFKCFIGLAALESGAITTDSEFECPSSFTLGRLTWRNWKKDHAGSLNFEQALTQSCNTWFYQVGLRTGAKSILEWANSVGFGNRTGIPLASESIGRIPSDEFMLRTHGRRILEGDVVNMSIGQGDILITPLQMARAMSILANGGTVYQPRLVSQVQTVGNEVSSGYSVRAVSKLAISPKTLAAIHEGMVDVVSSGGGTAASARVKKVRVAGKTGTAQWGPKRRERTAAWFAGFAPAEEPQFAFAAVYEGGPGDDSIHGGSHAAPLIGKLLREVFAKQKEEKKDAEKAAEKEAEEEAAMEDQSN